MEEELLVVRDVSVYKIPPRSTSGGYKCGEWLQSDKIWSGRLRVVSPSARKCEIRLEDPSTGELFATCPVESGKREATVESVTDSSRYFVLKIDDGRGRHAFIGLGFDERNDAFDFNVALSDHEKYVKRGLNRDQQQEQELDEQQQQTPALDLKLKEGETLKINVKTARSSNSAALVSAAAAAASKGTRTSVSSSVGGMKAPLAPPPGGGRIRSPLPPPTSASAANKDLLELNKKSSSNTAAGWAAF